MKIKQLCVGLCAAAMVASSALPVAAASFEELPEIMFEETFIEVMKGKNEKHERQGKRSPASKAAMEASKAKWDALNDGQKEEIYRLKDITFDTEMQIIDKYAEYGVIENETAMKIKSGLSEHKANMRKNKQMPRYKFMIKHEKKDKH